MLAYLDRNPDWPGLSPGSETVRHDRESGRIKAYIENNPVKAGLVANAEDSSLVERGKKSRDESPNS